MNDTRRFYALIFARDGDVDFAPLAWARQLADRHGGEAHALVCGPAPAPAIARARDLHLDHAWIIAAGADARQPRQDALQPHQLADRYAAALREPALAPGLDRALLLVATSPDNEELAGRLAACLDAAPLGRCLDIRVDTDGTLIAHRTAYGGRLDTYVRCVNGLAVAVVRGMQIPPLDAAVHGKQDESRPPLQEHTLSPDMTSAASYPVTALPRTETHAGLDGARLVVSGGRGIGGDSGFPLLYELADKLGGAVGASLPAVDAGWAPVARQVGQSGRYVSPDIYLAIGISGTPQHLAGIDPHTRIVAVNRDAEAPIFNAAQVGVVAEWQTLLPELLAALDETS